MHSILAVLWLLAATDAASATRPAKPVFVVPTYTLTVGDIGLLSIAQGTNPVIAARKFCRTHSLGRARECDRLEDRVCSDLPCPDPVYSREGGWLSLALALRPPQTQHRQQTHHHGNPPDHHVPRLRPRFARPLRLYSGEEVADAAHLFSLGESEDAIVQGAMAASITHDVCDVLQVAHVSCEAAKPTPHPRPARAEERRRRSVALRAVYAAAGAGAGSGAGAGAAAGGRGQPPRGGAKPWDPNESDLAPAATVVPVLLDDKRPAYITVPLAASSSNPGGTNDGGTNDGGTNSADDAAGGVVDAAVSSFCASNNVGFKECARLRQTTTRRVVEDKLALMQEVLSLQPYNDPGVTGVVVWLHALAHSTIRALFAKVERAEAAVVDKRRALSRLRKRHAREVAELRRELFLRGGGAEEGAARRGDEPGAEAGEETGELGEETRGEAREEAGDTVEKHTVAVETTASGGERRREGTRGSAHAAYGEHAEHGDLAELAEQGEHAEQGAGGAIAGDAIAGGAGTVSPPSTPRIIRTRKAMGHGSDGIASSEWTWDPRRRPIARIPASNLTLKAYRAFALRGEPVIITGLPLPSWGLASLREMCGDKKVLLKRRRKGARRWAELEAVRWSTLDRFLDALDARDDGAGGAGGEGDEDSEDGEGGDGGEDGEDGGAIGGTRGDHGNNTRSSGSVRAHATSSHTHRTGIRSTAGDSSGNAARTNSSPSSSSSSSPRTPLGSLYLHDMSVAEFCPALLHASMNLTIPSYFADDFMQRVDRSVHAKWTEWRDYWPSVFVGAAGTASALHSDWGDTAAWMGLVQGRKQWRVVPWRNRALLYERHGDEGEQEEGTKEGAGKGTEGRAGEGRRAAAARRGTSSGGGGGGGGGAGGNATAGGAAVGGGSVSGASGDPPSYSDPPSGESTYNQFRGDLFARGGGDDGTASHPDHHPALKGAGYWYGEQVAGDVIFLPGGAAHQVVNVGHVPTVAVAFNFIDAPGAARAEGALRGLAEEAGTGEEEAMYVRVADALARAADAAAREEEEADTGEGGGSHEGGGYGVSFCAFKRGEKRYCGGGNGGGDGDG
jgi:hypothetical protein